MASTGQEVVGVDTARVTSWFEENIEGFQAPMTVSLLAGGHSNLTYRVVDAAGTAYALRRPPTGAVLATAHDMAREHKIISGVGRTDVPVPPALGLCEDEAVNDAPFYVMGFVDGVVLDNAEKVEEHFADESLRRIAANDVVTDLAALHAIEPDDIGLGDLGRREAYLARQMKRWRTQWEKSKTRELPLMEELADTLESDMPEQVGSGIVHGDYRLGNMLTAKDGHVAAILDWELCTLGDPLADVGYLLNNWAQPGEEGPTSRGAAAAPTAAGGFSTREELIERYAELSGRDLSGIGYYRAFQYWRLAAIVEGVLARYLKGVMGADADTDAFKAQVEGLAVAARDVLDT
ncbi:MAG: phosphotransferase family protein [Actinomycetota bacterium]|nr:phosphotransferase family protein [Actinomycetota bacterium]